MPVSESLSLLSTGAALGFLPLAMIQSARLRSDALATPLPSGMREGAVGEVSAPTLDLLVVGDSTAIGGGCEHMDLSLPPRLAYGVGMRLHRRVRWQALGGPGFTAAQLDNSLRRRGVPHADIALVLVGVNDVVALTPRAAWGRQIRRIVARLFDAGAGLVVLSGVPSLDTLPGLTWPLGPLLGVRSRQLDRVAQALTRPLPLAPERSLIHAPAPQVDAAAHLSADGVHPSSAGYAHWAHRLADITVREFMLLPHVPAHRVGDFASSGR